MSETLKENTATRTEYIIKKDKYSVCEWESECFGGMGVQGKQNI